MEFQSMNNGLAYWKERKLDSLRGIVKFLKGVWHEIFIFEFFSWTSEPRAPEYQRHRRSLTIRDKD